MWDFLASLGKAIWGVWTLDTSLGVWFVGLPYSLELSATVAVLAGASTMAGNSVVLFLNRVRGLRFAIGLLLNGVGFVALYAMQALVIAVVGYLVTGEQVNLVSAAQAVMLSTAPLIFGFFELIPYLGPGVARVLQAWSVAALLVIVGALYGVGLWQAVVVTGVGWGLMQLLSWALSRPLTRFGNLALRTLTGHRTLLTGQDLLAGHQFVPVEFDFDLGQPGRRQP